MTKVNLSDLANLNNQASAVATINSNSATIETAFDNTISRDGSTPNQMLVDFDMNGRKILNVPAPTSPTDLVRVQDIDGGLTTTTNYIPLSNYASLAAAITAIGASQTTLLIDTGAIVSADLTLPSTLTITANPGKIITVNTGITLNVKSPLLIPDEQEIFNTVGTGKINFKRWGIPVGWFGVNEDNGDNHPKFIQMMNATVDCGGTFLFAPVVYNFISNIVLPNTGGTEPTQASRIFRGSSFYNMGRGDFVPRGTTLKFFSGVGTAHIATYGSGSLLIEDMILMAGVDTFLPFVYTTYTSLKCNRVCFSGFNFGTAANNDCVVFGGTTNVQDGSVVIAPFQGYGAGLTNCIGNRIRRLAYGRIFANAITIRDNWVWVNCGNLTGGVIELDGTGGVGIVDFNEGWTVEGNQVEMHQYLYFAKLKSAPWNSFQSNHLYDLSGITLGVFLLEDGNCFRNKFHGGVHTDANMPFVIDGFNNLYNDIIPGNLSVLKYSQHGPARFAESITPLTTGTGTVGDLNRGWSSLWLHDNAGTPVINFQEGQGQIAWNGSTMFYAGANTTSHVFNAPVGYALGAGGTVTQATNKSTAVTLNKTSGAITMNAASLAAGASVSFTLNNTFINATDTIVVMIKSGASANSYNLEVTGVAAGSCTIQIRNFTGGALAESVVISYMVFHTFHS